MRDFPGKHDENMENKKHKLKETQNMELFQGNNVENRKRIVRWARSAGGVATKTRTRADKLPDIKRIIYNKIR